jgi:hypothetical protein
VEDNQSDPYYLLTITAGDGQVVRHIKTGASKGLHRITWDLRYAPSEPVVGRYYPAPDQLFGSGPQGHLVAPGIYRAQLFAYQDGKVSALTETTSFEVKWLNQSSLPTPNPADNVAFLNSITDASKQLNAITDLLLTLEERTKQAELAILDMAAPEGGLLAEAHAIRQELLPARMTLLGDATRASREFEASPSVSDRIGTVAGSAWNTTSAIPQTHKASFNIAVKQMEKVIPEVLAIKDRMDVLDKTLTELKAPYTPGRWPEKK